MISADNFSVDSVLYVMQCVFIMSVSKGKAVPLQAWSGVEGSRKLRFPDFMTMATGLW